jgi:S-(hydroxymethyl)glutathione dehydrogenase/alcohol dehydrogenase
MKTKAAILYEINKPLVIKDIEIPSLKRGQVLVEILYAGICQTQLNEMRGLKGPDKHLPHLLGHEGSGIVKEIGSEVTKVKPGDYVVLTWLKGAGLEGGPVQYRDGQEIINSGQIATWASHAVISENRMVQIDKDIPPDFAALLGCAIPTGAGIIKNQIPEKIGKTLAIFGMGGVGASALLYAKTQGFEKNIAVDINEKKLHMAKEFGADITLDASMIDVVSFMNSLGGVDYAVECSGSKDAMEAAFKSLNDKGLAIIAGNIRSGEKIQIDPFDLIKGKRIIGSWGGGTNIEEDMKIYAKNLFKNSFPIKDKLKVISIEEINMINVEDKYFRKIINLNL